MSASAPAQNYSARLPILLKIIRQFNFPRKLGILERLFGKRIAQLGTARVVLANGKTWKLDLAEPCHRWMVYGNYEGPHLIGWIRKWLQPGGVVVDSGANIGQTLVYYADDPNVTTIAFEPNESAADWLAECLAFYPQWKVKVERTGLDNINTTRSFQLAGAMSTMRLDWYVDKGYKQSVIKVVPLDDYMAASNIRRIRLWKIDVEGCELAALQGASNLLRQKNIDALIIEVSQGTFSEVKNLLASFDYRLYTMGKNGTLGVFHEENIKGTTNLIALAQPGAVQ